MRTLLGPLLAIFFAWGNAALAVEPELTLAIGDTTRSFTSAALLARADAVTIIVPHDIAYGRPMTYQAVPVAALLDGTMLPTDTVLEAMASDGFVAQLPRQLVLNRDPAKAVAMVAIEEPGKPWPALPGKSVSAGPFYLVWVGAVATVRSEYWPYQTVRLSTQEAPAKRWPQLEVESAIPDEDPLRTGQFLFVAQCLVCHTLNGAGASQLGPDLNLPMNPTDYLLPSALAKLIRNPASVRTWSTQQMPAMPETALSDDEIELIIAYLQHMAGRKRVAGASAGIP
jgi:mono/diheme cytochrome c family protein